MRHEREQSRDEHLTSIRAPQYLLREGGDATSAATRGAYPRVTYIYHARRFFFCNRRAEEPGASAVLGLSAWTCRLALISSRASG